MNILPHTKLQREGQELEDPHGWLEWLILKHKQMHERYELNGIDKQENYSLCSILNVVLECVQSTFKTLTSTIHKTIGICHVVMILLDLSSRIISYHYIFYIFLLTYNKKK